ncbi:MAG: tetratricopeptide repeat protein [Acidobacteria bacterium]|nr:tetratricopeptide repeat protein [Acidobacteriota bacterium]
MRLLHSTCVCTLLAFSATAQFPSLGPPSDLPRSSTIFNGGLQGRLLTNDNVDPSQLRVVIVDTSRRSVVGEALINPMGNFDLNSVSGGVFELRIIDRAGDTVYATGVTLPQSIPLNINLRSRNVAATRRPMSIARLQHKIPKKAKQQFELAARLHQEQKLEDAVAALKQALTIDPQYFEAANNLGALYVKSGRYPQAFEMFHRATTIDASDPLAEANLAFVLLKMQRFPEAEDAARASVRSDSLSGRARFLLALSLLEQHKSRAEALFHLTRAKDDFEPASQLLTQLKSAEGPK